MPSSNFVFRTISAATAVLHTILGPAYASSDLSVCVVSFKKNITYVDGYLLHVVI